MINIHNTLIFVCYCDFSPHLLLFIYANVNLFFDNTKLKTKKSL
ncbi:hypothetical protein HMPREF0653_02012 [Prevotella disiens JCM 6334 = ATCC 29426]|uniref:Uncharacterized protein n=1 Tax=Prevotella disiens JCM 6334 = ATCC 29426 TaxID=1235811 RepID=A0ABN0NQF9_9BACT|nr:hypothetical protein HMPREF0653_02012 [Prevotella disiens JCM 6334 = ATCC 29426]